MENFNIACCETAGLIISDNIRGGNNKNKILEKFKNDYNLEGSLDDVFNIVKNVFHENLANDKYGVNNFPPQKPKDLKG